MAIPVISEIFSFLQSLIQAMPKSLRYIIFLVFIVGVFAIIPFIFHMMGIHCDSNKNVMKTSFFRFSDNYELSTFTLDDLYNSSQYKPVVRASLLSGAIGNKETCTKLIKLNHTGFWGDFYDYCNADDVNANNPNCLWALNINNFKGWFSNNPKCIICSDQRDVTFQSTSTINNGQYCFSEAYSNNASGCPQVDLCDVPIGFYFDNLTGDFTCLDTTLCGANATSVQYDVDIKLRSIGAKRYYDTGVSDKDYKAAVKFACDKSLNPQLTIFGIPVFDYRMWLALIVLGAMFFWLSHIKGH